MKFWRPIIEHSTKVLAGAILTSIVALGTIMVDASKTLSELAVSVAELKASSYNTEYLELKYELAGVSDEDIIPTIQYWVEDQKGGKLGALSTLCGQKPQVLMADIVGFDKVAEVCRFAPGAVELTRLGMKGHTIDLVRILASNEESAKDRYGAYSALKLVVSNE